MGTVLGSAVAGWPAERYGRKAALVAIAATYVVGSLGCGLAWDWHSLVAFRFLGGIAVGAASVVAPLYIAEISPAAVRGRLVALSQFNVVAGILAAYLSNYLIASATDGPVAWRWMLGIQAVPSLLFLVALVPIPESPRWLAKVGRTAEARAVLASLGDAAPDRELADIVESLEGETAAAREPLFQRKYRRPILLAFMVATFNQLSGINALIYYMADIFKMAGAGTSSALLQSVVIGATNLAFTVLGMAVIDRVGRKPLLLIGAAGLAACLGTTAYAFATGTGGTLVLASLIGFIAFFAFSQGAVIWVYISEIFPNRVRGRGQALGSFTHWFWCAAVAWTFPVVAAASGGSAFAFFAAMMALQFVLVWRLLPETKGVSLEDIQKRLGSNDAERGSKSERLRFEVQSRDAAGRSRALPTGERRLIDFKPQTLGLQTSSARYGAAPRANAVGRRPQARQLPFQLRHRRLGRLQIPRPAEDFHRLRRRRHVPGPERPDRPLEGVGRPLHLHRVPPRQPVPQRGQPPRTRLDEDAGQFANRSTSPPTCSRAASQSVAAFSPADAVAGTVSPASASNNSSGRIGLET